MENTFIISESDCDPFSFDGKKIHLHLLKPEFFKWTGSKFENVFVGVCSVIIDEQKVVVYSLPKYYPKAKCVRENLDEIKVVLKKICCVAEKLKQDHPKSNIFFDADSFFEPYKLKDKVQNVNRVELAEFLIEDYVRNGLYVKDVLVTKKNGIGRTNWGKTVLKTTPIIQNSEVVYLDSINREHIVDENNIISIIHAKVISQCLDLMGPLMSSGIVPVESTDIIGDNLEKYAQEINAQSSYVFRERDINLFKALEAWCKSTKYYENYIGVIHFDRLWEWVNDSVWGNMSSLKSSNPTYYFTFDKEYGFKGTGSAIPDTVRVELDDNKGSCGKKVYVFDSKYYILKYLQKHENDNEKEILGWPANSDIAKQIEYLELLKHLIGQVTGDKTVIEYRNAFLLPEPSTDLKSDNLNQFIFNDGTWFKKVGYVEQGIFDELIKSITGFSEDLKIEARTVDLIIIKPDSLYDHYLNNRKVSAEELKSIWKTET